MPALIPGYGLLREWVASVGERASLRTSELCDMWSAWYALEGSFAVSMCGTSQRTDNGCTLLKRSLSVVVAYPAAFLNERLGTHVTTKAYCSDITDIRSSMVSSCWM
jgi:hypothetical protein